MKKNIEQKNEKIEDKKDRCLFFAKFNKSCIITYIGICFAILAIYFAFVKMAFAEIEYIRYSLICLIISGICDMFDGKFARMCKRTEEEKEFGIQLDSLADVFCFIATPIVIMSCKGMIEWYFVLAYMLFAICGISRLGYFNITADKDKAVKSYNGLPVTSTAIIYPLIGLFYVWLPINILKMIYLIATFLTGILFVVNIKIPKLVGKAYIIVPIFAIIGIILLLVV